MSNSENQEAISEKQKRRDIGRNTESWGEVAEPIRKMFDR